MNLLRFILKSLRPFVISVALWFWINWAFDLISQPSTFLVVLGVTMLFIAGVTIFRFVKQKLIELNIINKSKQ
jgi:hypothetical protein